MTIQEFLGEYHNLEINRRQLGIKEFFNILLCDTPRYEDFILDIMSDATVLEQDDYFGTEGAKI